MDDDYISFRPNLENRCGVSGCLELCPRQDEREPPYHLILTIQFNHRVPEIWKDIRE
jgi:hypothetical protein